jgi:Mn2+/Fe2+ NRAMP family transporter
MNELVDLALGIVSAMGGFVDIGELIFLTQSGSKFLLSLMWVLVLGSVGVIVYSEMAGRMTAVTGYTVFDAVRIKLGRRLGGVALASSVLVTVITASAEVGGMGLILELATGLPFWLCACIGAVLAILIVAILPFRLIENGLGILGLMMLIFLAAVFFKNGATLGDLWQQSGEALKPDGPHLLLYAYFVVGILTSTMMPYELIFYSSGAIEDEWTSKELGINRVITTVGFSFGLLVAAALMFNAAAKLAPLGIDPQLLGATALQAILPFGWWGGWIALAGMFFAITGAAVETSMSVGYMICQFLEKPWGKKKSFKDAPLYHGLWFATLVVGLIAVLIYSQPIQIAEYAVVFSVLALPLAYLAVWLTASDRQLMGMHVNGPIAWTGGVLFLAVLVIAAVAAIPLLIVTSAGEIW